MRWILSCSDGWAEQECRAHSSHHRRQALPRMRFRSPSVRRLRRKRSEEHTSELPSLMRISYAVFCLKKKQTLTTNTPQHTSQSTTQQKTQQKRHGQTYTI